MAYLALSPSRGSGTPPLHRFREILLRGAEVRSGNAEALLCLGDCSKLSLIPRLVSGLLLLSHLCQFEELTEVGLLESFEAHYLYPILPSFCPSII